MCVDTVWYGECFAELSPVIRFGWSISDWPERGVLPLPPLKFVENEDSHEECTCGEISFVDDRAVAARACGDSGNTHRCGELPKLTVSETRQVFVCPLPFMRV